MSGIAEVLLNLGYTVSRLGPEALARSPSAWRRSAPRSSRATPPANVAGAHVVVVSLRRRGATTRRWPRRAGSADPRDPARRDAGRADAAQVRHRGRRQPRQDHDHVDGRRHPRPRRARPHRRRGRRASRRWARTRGWAGATSWWSRPTRATGSFLKLTPILAVVTNIDREHLDCYRDLDDIQERLRRVRQQGAVLRRAVVLPRRRERPGHPARASSAASSPTAPRRRPIVAARDLDAAVPPAAPSRARTARPAARAVHAGVPGRAQRRRTRSAAVAVGLDLELPFEHDPARARRRSAASTAASRCAARPRA